MYIHVPTCKREDIYYFQGKEVKSQKVIPDTKLLETEKNGGGSKIALSTHKS